MLLPEPHRVFALALQVPSSALPLPDQAPLSKGGAGPLLLNNGPFFCRPPRPPDLRTWNTAAGTAGPCVQEGTSFLPADFFGIPSRPQVLLRSQREASRLPLGPRLPSSSAAAFAGPGWFGPVGLRVAGLSAGMSSSEMAILNDAHRPHPVGPPAEEVTQLGVDVGRDGYPAESPEATEKMLRLTPPTNETPTSLVWFLAPAFF